MRGLKWIGLGLAVGIVFNSGIGTRPTQAAVLASPIAGGITLGLAGSTLLIGVIVDAIDVHQNRNNPNTTFGNGCAHHCAGGSMESFWAPLAGVIGLVGIILLDEAQPIDQTPLLSAIHRAYPEIENEEVVAELAHLWLQKVKEKQITIQGGQPSILLSSFEIRNLLEPTGLLESRSPRAKRLIAHLSRPIPYVEAK